MQAGSPPHDPAEAFEREAERKSEGLLRQLWGFLRVNKKWWLLPIVIVLLLVGLLVLVAGGATPFLYPIF